MMNRTHSVTGAVSALLVLPALPGPLRPVGVAEVLYAAVGAGAAILPDLDHHDSYPTHFMPLVTRPLHWVVSGVCGGHRRAAHWLAAGVVAAVLAVLGPVLHSAAATLLTAAVLSAMGCWAMGLGDRTGCLAGGAGLAGLAWVDASLHHGGFWWLAPAVLAGYVAHILGDLVFGGCEVSRDNFTQLAELKTGGVIEVGLVRPLSWLALGLVSIAAMVGWGRTIDALGQLVAAFHS